MAKLTPQERWRRHILERFTALEMSGELKPLRAEGLALLKRNTLLSAEEWWQQDISKLISSPKYLKWYRKCEEVSVRFGLDHWVARAACLLEGFSPEKEGLTMASNCPQIRVVTDNTNSLFLQWLCYEAKRLGLFVIQRRGASETTMISAKTEPPSQLLTSSSRPPRGTAFHMRVETPEAYPPEAASQLHQKASNLGRELLRRLGYPSPLRLRSSPLVTMATQLKADKAKLTEAEALEVIDQLYPHHKPNEDITLLKRSRSAKHKVRKKIVKPYHQKP